MPIVQQGSINTTALAYTDGHQLEVAEGATFRKRSDGRKVVLREKLAEPVGLLYHYPGFPPSLLHTAIADCKGLVIAGVGEIRSSPPAKVTTPVRA